MPMHISPMIDTDSGPTVTTFSRMGQITDSLSPVKNDILGILQREQDHAVELLSLSPLLSSLFISYANRAAALETTSATPSPESEEWKSLQDAVAGLQEENEKLKLENLEVVGKMEAAMASREAFCSQVSSLKEVNTTQQGDIRLLRAELAEVKVEYDRLVADSNAERTALRIKNSDLEARREELKETVVEQQIKISRLERQGLTCLSDPPKAPVPTGTVVTFNFETPEDQNATNVSARTTKAKECAEQEAKEWAEREAKERAERAAREEAEQKAMKKAEELARVRAEQAEKEAKEMVVREAKEMADQEAREKAEREAGEAAEREKERLETRAAKEKAEREAKEKAERDAEASRGINKTAAKQKAVKEARERAEREAKEKAEREIKGKMDRVEERLAGREGLESEAKEKAEREEKDGYEVGRNSKEMVERAKKEKAEREESERRLGFQPSTIRPANGSTPGFGKTPQNPVVSGWFKSFADF